MSISNTDLYNQKRRQFKALASNNNFKTDYITAVNRTLSTIGTRLDLASQPDLVNDTETVLDIDIDYAPAVSCGVDYWLIVLGNKAGAMDSKVAFAAYENSIADAMLRRDLDIAATEVADEDYDMIANLDD